MEVFILKDSGIVLRLVITDEKDVGLSTKTFWTEICSRMTNVNFSNSGQNVQYIEHYRLVIWCDKCKIFQLDTGNYLTRPTDLQLSGDKKNQSLRY